MAPPGTWITYNGCSGHLHHQQLASCQMFPESPHSPSCCPHPSARPGSTLPSHPGPPAGDLGRGTWHRASRACMDHFHTANWTNTDSVSSLPVQATVPTPQLLPGCPLPAPLIYGTVQEGGRVNRAWGSCRPEPMQALLPIWFETWGR